jgi:hypothetical protein
MNMMQNFWFYTANAKDGEHVLICFQSSLSSCFWSPHEALQWTNIALWLFCSLRLLKSNVADDIRRTKRGTRRQAPALDEEIELER